VSSPLTQKLSCLAGLLVGMIVIAVQRSATGISIGQALALLAVLAPTSSFAPALLDTPMSEARSLSVIEVYHALI
jgi:hypothetical protein